ncbi:MAG: acyl-CoA-binding protein [Burkholderiaceae bacterium]
MSALDEKFTQAIADSKALPERPDNPTLLKLYGLYKQASTGDCADPEPGATDFVAKAKWDAWLQLSGLGADEAKQQYVDLIESLKG